MTSFCIEMDSMYRNRKLWPEPAEFEVVFSDGGFRNKYVANDPVSNAMPHKYWTSNNLDASIGGCSNSITVTISGLTSPDTIGCAGDNQYIPIIAPSGSLQVIKNYYSMLVARNTTTGEKRRIILYDYIGKDSSGNDRARITVLTPFGPSLSEGDTIVILDPTDFADPSNLLMFIPSGSNDNAYLNQYMYNETVNEYRKITYYDINSHIVYVKNSNPVVGWTTCDSFSIRNELPLFYGVITMISGATKFQINSPMSSDNYYSRMYLRITSGIHKNETRLITGYNGSTQTLTVETSFSGVGILVGTRCEILDFSFDNDFPFQIDKMGDDDIYEVRLLNLVVPNMDLNAGFGNRIAYYPYIHVELNNGNGSASGTRSSLISNSPSSANVVFRCPVVDNTHPSISTFVNFTSIASQYLKLNLETQLKLVIRLPNGDLYKTIEKEWYSPSIPNASCQISAMFQFTRIT
jgi:hypothetical protein